MTISPRKLARALFGTKLNALLTVLMLALFALTLPPLFHWAIEAATWDAVNRRGCTPGGACWAFIRARLALFFYGTYPLAERWRVHAALLVLAVALAGTLFARRHRAAWLGMLLLGVPLIDGLLLAGGLLGLPAVPTPDWGGLMLNVVLSFVAIAGSLPIGAGLAFGRRSRWPVLRLLCIAMIEFWRGVPLLAVLFMGLILLPMFLPGGVTVDNLVRALIVLTLFTSAYMAEAIRGGLQGVPQGQSEAALALGMHAGLVNLLVVLPQALRIALPGIVNIVVDLFKDTTLVAVVGLFDLMGVVMQSLKDSSWLGLAAEGYTFAAVTFFLACLLISLTGSMLERRLGSEASAPRR